MATYYPAGWDTATTYPGSYLHPVVMRRSYDPDDNVVTRSGPFTSGDALTRDASGRLVAGAIGDIAGNGPASIRLVYGPLGAVVYAENLAQGATFEEDSVEALGNRLWQRAYGVRPDYPDRHRRLFLDAYTGRLDSIRLVDPLPAGFPGTFQRHHVARYDAAGNSHQTYGWPGAHLTDIGWYADLDEAVSYFDADDRLRIFNRHVNYGGVSSPGGLYEEYRYDALGRRVFVRSRRTSSCAQAPGYHYQCGSYVERTVWDGAQVLYEIRGGGGDSLDVGFLEDDGGGLPATEPHMFGRAVYTHALGIDQPVGILRFDAGSWTFLAPHANWRGSYTYGTLASGAVCPGAVECPLAPWPADIRTADGGSTSTAPTEYTAWYGNLITAQADGSGLRYRRNRYYDPATGRFTQQDPIGLAGGLNLYGFASGDPVNFSDPFGLCPFTGSSLPCGRLLANWGARTGREWAVNLGAGIEAAGAVADAFMGGGCSGGLSCGMGVPGAPGGGALFSGGRAGLRELLRTGWIEGMSGRQGLRILARLAKSRVDEVTISAGESGNIVASFTRLLDEGKEVTVRTYNAIGTEVSTIRREYDAAGALVREGVIR